MCCSKAWRLFVRYELMINAPLPEGDQAARAVGRDRFEAFVARVGEALAGGHHTFEYADDGAGDERGRRMTGASHDRRRAMLRTAMGPAIAAALADPLVIEIMVNPDGALRLDRLGEGRTRHRRPLRPRPGRADHPPGRQPCADRGPCRLADRLGRAAAAWGGRRRAVRGRAAAGVAGALLLDPQARGARLHAARLCERRHHGRRRRAAAAPRRRRAPQHPRRRRHQLGQDHAGQRPARRDGRISTSA